MNEEQVSCEAREMLYPTWRYDHAKGFAALTKDLAYHRYEHLQEENPTDLSNFHLLPRIIRKPLTIPRTQTTGLTITLEQVDAAEGRLRSLLHGELQDPSDRLPEANGFGRD